MLINRFLLALILIFSVSAYTGSLIVGHRTTEHIVCHQYVKDKTELICEYQANR